MTYLRTIVQNEKPPTEVNLPILKFSAIYNRVDCSVEKLQQINILLNSHYFCKVRSDSKDMPLCVDLRSE